jgi:hypothetical protein
MTILTIGQISIPDKIVMVDSPFHFESLFGIPIWLKIDHMTVGDVFSFIILPKNEKGKIKSWILPNEVSCIHFMTHNFMTHNQYEKLKYFI